MNVHAALEGLVDRFQQSRERLRVWRELRGRRALRRRLRTDRTFYIDSAPSDKCIVPNEPRNSGSNK